MADGCSPLYGLPTDGEVDVVGLMEMIDEVVTVVEMD